MANVIPYAFRGELFTGTHNFASGGDSFKLALYTANPYNTSSTVYNATSEVSSSSPYIGYTTTGNTLTGNAVAYGTAVASYTVSGFGIEKLIKINDKVIKNISKKIDYKIY